MKSPAPKSKSTLLLFFYNVKKCQSALLITILLCTCLLLNKKGIAQSLGLNTTGSIPDSSAMLDIMSANKGLLIPRVSLTSVTDSVTIVNPAVSLQVYNTNDSMTGGSVGFWYWNGTQWVRVSSDGSENLWGTTGNQATVAGTNFLGTTDAQALVFKTNNAERMRILSDGNVGIGITPSSGVPLHVGKNMDINGAVSIYSAGIIQTPVTSNASYFRSTASTVASSFSLIDLFHYRAVQGTFGAGSTVTNQIGYSVHSTLTGATNNYGFKGDIAAGTNRWNVYMGGTAKNYFAGDVGIGTTSPGSKLDVVGTANVSTSTTTPIVYGGSAANGDIQIEGTSSGTKTTSYVNMQTTGGAVNIGTITPLQSATTSAGSALSVATTTHTVAMLKSYGSAGLVPILALGTSRGTSIGSEVATANGNPLGFVTFEGVNTSNTPAIAAYIQSYQDGAGGATYIPGRLMFWTGTSTATPAERMRIDNVGNVGIGTIAPAQKLEISELGVASNPSIVYPLRITNTQTGGSYQAKAGLEFKVNTFLSRIVVEENGVASSSHNLCFEVSNSGTPIEWMRILANGRVGIGTSSPLARLHTVATTEQLRLGYNSSNYYSTTVDSAGAVTFNAVGSGTTSFTFSDAATINGVSTFNGSVVNKYAVLTGATTLDDTYYNVNLTNAGSSYAITLPNPAAGNTGRTYRIKQMTGANCTVTTVGGDPVILGLTGTTGASYTLSPGKGYVEFQSDGTNWVVNAY